MAVAFIIFDIISRTELKNYGLFFGLTCVECFKCINIGLFVLLRIKNMGVWVYDLAFLADVNWYKGFMETSKLFLIDYYFPSLATRKGNCPQDSNLIHYLSKI